MSGRLDTAWARWSRPWTIAALVIPNSRYRTRFMVGFTTNLAGVAGGSGIPVENASFMPWLAGTVIDALTSGNRKAWHI